MSKRSSWAIGISVSFDPRLQRHNLLCPTPSRRPRGTRAPCSEHDADRHPISRRLCLRVELDTTSDTCFARRRAARVLIWSEMRCGSWCAERCRSVSYTSRRSDSSVTPSYVACTRARLPAHDRRVRPPSEFPEDLGEIAAVGDPPQTPSRKRRSGRYGKMSITSRRRGAPASRARTRGRGGRVLGEEDVAQRPVEAHEGAELGWEDVVGST